MTRSVQWERMFPDELEEAFNDRPIVYFTYGLCEPHGPHCAVGLDSLKMHGIAVSAASEHGGIVAPPDFWHCHELGGYALWAEKKIGNVPRAWLTSEPPWMHFKRICYHIRAAEILGFRAAFFLTGHYGPNYLDLQRICELAQPYVKMRILGLAEFEVNHPGFSDNGPNADHAGKVETSLLWSLHPECVDMSRLPSSQDSSTTDSSCFQTPPYFALGDTASDSNRVIGDRMVKDEIGWLKQKGDELLKEYDELREVVGMRTFDDVESFWRNEIEPIITTFVSMQDRWGQQTNQLDSSSRWFENWQTKQGK